MEKKCIKHINAVSLKVDAPMDTTFYEVGCENECVICLNERHEKDEKQSRNDDDFNDALATFLIADTGKDRKKAVLDIFLNGGLHSPL